MASILNTMVAGQPGDINAWFSNTWNMPWVAEKIGLTHLVRKDNHVAPVGFNKYALPETYRTEAILLKNVPSSTSLYAANPQNMICTSITPGMIEVMELLTGVALSPCGSGWLGYIGDTAGTWETTEIMLAMLVAPP
ncbi:hypothetical protein F5Y18DRAFT_374099 [Xylariaceae sp. FL1019]|nr:hypothetical protein F5Y18DRAFT_374099 [Xylariaceae sp. FL1019]